MRKDKGSTPHFNFFAAIYIYIYIYRERERGGDGEIGNAIDSFHCNSFGWVTF